MEVLKISDSKLKLMLDRSDMIKFGIRQENVDYNNAEVRKSFFRILDSVKQSHGFDAEGDKLLIQYYPSKEGGCELFITKLGLLPPATERAISRSARVTLLSARRMVYKFDDLDALIRASKTVRESGVKSSDVFLDEGGEYYLEILERGGGVGGQISEYARLSEFAKTMPQSFYPYITEHCEKLTEGNAIALFSSL